MSSMVIKVGGSLLYNEDASLNVAFLDIFKKWYLVNANKFEKLVIVVGGGKLSRNVGNNIKNYVSSDYVHSVAMQITQANAEMLKGYIGLDEITTLQDLEGAYKALKYTSVRLIITGGLKTGWSTDMDSAVFADILKLKTVYKLSNIKGVYTSDPKIDSNAKFIQTITWDEYITLFDINEHKEHHPNKSSPLSVETVIFCKNKGLNFYISGGETISSSQDLSYVFESGTKISS